ncbi:amino acid ABC transporter permease [soil metagenome]
MSETEAAAPTAGPEPEPSRQEQRAEAKRHRARRGQAIAVASSVIVLGGLAALAYTSPGWDDVSKTFFSWQAFSESFPDVLRGFWLDVRIFLFVEVAVLILGLGIALLRTIDAPALFPLRLLAIVYTDLFRGFPVILLVYLIGFGVPALQLSGLPTDKVVLGGLALTLAYSAYVAEVYRAGLRSVHRGQRDAALAIGLTERQSLRYVVIPQAVRRVGPPLLNDFISLQKDVALVAILGPQEAYRIATITAASDFNYTPLLAAALLYLLITVPLARLLDRWDANAGGVTR